MSKTALHTDRAPTAIGTYSQAIRHGDTVYISGQIPLNPATMELIEGDIEDQIRRVIENLSAICNEAGGSLDAIVRLTVYLTDLSNFGAVNAVMEEYFSQPYPARAAIGAADLPRGAAVEMDAVLGL